MINSLKKERSPIAPRPFKFPSVFVDKIFIAGPRGLGDPIPRERSRSRSGSTDGRRYAAHCFHERDSALLIGIDLSGACLENAPGNMYLTGNAYCRGRIE